jgi:hypothetical protein
MPASTQASAPAPVSRFSSQPDPSDPAWQAIAAKHGGQPEVNVTIKSKPGEPDPSDIEWQQIAKQFGGAPEDPTGGAGQPVQYDTPLDAVKGFAGSMASIPKGMFDFGMALGQALPLPKAIGGGGLPIPQSWGGSGEESGSVKLAKALGAPQGVVWDRGVASLKAGDYGTAARHFADFLIPVIGPQLDDMADKAAKGQPWRGSGEAMALALQLFGPQKLAQMSVKVPGVAANPNALEAAAVKFGQDHGIPIDAATATGNKGVQGVQFVADRSISGSLLGSGRGQRVADSLQRVLGEQAVATGGAATSPEAGGATIGDVLKAKAARAGSSADVAYTRMRELAAQPEHQLDVPTAPVPVDALPSDLMGQIRRMVHELDAAPKTDRLLQQGKVGSSLEHVEGTGGEGAQVFHDITQLSGSTLPRWKIQQELEQYLAGGKETSNVTAAIDVAKQRAAGKGGYTVSKPELPPSAMDVPTKLEGGRQRFESMGLPVFIGDAKTSLRALEREFDRALPEAAQKANPGLHAIRNILAGPDWVPLEEADRNLSALKDIARKRGGIAKRAVAEYGKAVTKASEAGSPEVAQSLNAGRAATVAKYRTLDVLGDVLKTNEEPVGAFKRLTANADANINLLRRVQREAPQAMPDLGRAYLEDMMRRATTEGNFQKSARLKNEWDALGSQTKQLLFPGQVADLDRFFLLAKKLHFDPNPSGSGAIVQHIGTGMKVAEGFAAGMAPVAAAIYDLGMGGLSVMLHSKTGVKLLTNGLSLTVGKAPVAAQAAAAARIVATAREMGLPVTQGARAGAPAQSGAGSAGR